MTATFEGSIVVRTSAEALFGLRQDDTVPDAEARCFHHPPQSRRLRPCRFMMKQATIIILSIGSLATGCSETPEPATTLTVSGQEPSIASGGLGDAWITTGDKPSAADDTQSFDDVFDTGEIENAPTCIDDSGCAERDGGPCQKPACEYGCSADCSFPCESFTRKRNCRRSAAQLRSGRDSE